MAQIDSIGIVGTGVIGASWAAFYATRGFEIQMYDQNPDQCRQGRQQAVGMIVQLQDQGLLKNSDVDQCSARIHTCEELACAVESVQLVQESVAENIMVKQRVFNAMDAATAPDVILASSSSGLLMTDIQKATQYPGRCLIAHPFNPPHLIPLVELVGGEATDAETLTTMKHFYEGLGKVPVVVQKPVPGHIANRLALALWREAVDLVVSGVASVEDVDKAVSAGPGLRWAIMGPHLIYHLGGGEGGMDQFIDHFGPAVKSWWESMANWTTLPPESKSVLIEGLKKEMGDRSLADISRWRDEKLAGLLKLISQ